MAFAICQFSLCCLCWHVSNGGPDCRNFFFMNISLIHIKELALWLYAVYCNLSIYSKNECISKIIKVLVTRQLFSILAIYFNSKYSFLAKAMIHTDTVDHLFVFSSLYVWHFFCLILNVAFNNTHQDMEGKKLATAAIKKKAIIYV